MKLRNKKTGEIAEFIVHKRVEDSEDGNKVYAQVVIKPDEWENYEEPKRFYWVDYDGKICNAEIGTMDRSRIKQIGNYFETKEEAEKAVEKLKAWKRLKDKGFSIYSWDYEFDIVDKPAQTIILRASAVNSSNTDLDLLFGGEE